MLPAAMTRSRSLNPEVLMSMSSSSAPCALFGFQILMLLSLVFVAIQVVVIGIFSVETPRWLINHNRVDDARAALVRLRGPDTDVDAELNTLLNEGGPQKSSQSNEIGTETTISYTRYLKWPSYDISLARVFSYAQLSCAV